MDTTCAPGPTKPVHSQTTSPGPTTAAAVSQDAHTSATEAAAAETYTGGGMTVALRTSCQRAVPASRLT